MQQQIKRCLLKLRVESSPPHNQSIGSSAAAAAQVLTCSCSYFASPQQSSVQVQLNNCHVAWDGRMGWELKTVLLLPTCPPTHPLLTTNRVAQTLLQSVQQRSSSPLLLVHVLAHQRCNAALYRHVIGGRSVGWQIEASQWLWRGVAWPVQRSDH